MIQETMFRIAFAFLLMALFAMRFYFMFKVRRSGRRLMPDRKAVQREGGRGVEKMMIEAFGDEYKAYMQPTDRYFPKL